MPRETKGNAKNYLSDATIRFQKVTGESIGVVYSWKGTLSVLGDNSFRQHVSDSTEFIWRALTFGKSTFEDSGLVQDKESKMLELVKKDINSHNVQTLRKILSWATQKTTSKFSVFVDQCKCTSIYYQALRPWSGWSGFHQNIFCPVLYHLN